MNFAPQAIPPVSGATVLTSTKNSVIFDVSNVSKIWVRFDFKRSTKPRPAAEHNCDSALRMQGRFDGGEWRIHSVLCGAYPDENVSWERNVFSFPVKPGAKTFQFAMDLYLQNNPSEMTDRNFLIDNAMIIGDAPSTAATHRKRTILMNTACNCMSLVVHALNAPGLGRQEDFEISLDRIRQGFWGCPLVTGAGGCAGRIVCKTIFTARQGATSPSRILVHSGSH